MKAFWSSAIRANRATLTGVAVVLALGMLACNDRPKTDEEKDRELRQKSAEAAASLKQGAKEATIEARQATAVAARELGVVASGVKEGLQANPGRLDLNTATTDQVATLPGIGHSKAAQIVKARPYGSTHDLVARGIVTESQYERISTRITAR